MFTLRQWRWLILKFFQLIILQKEMSYLDGQMLDNCFCNVLVWGMNYNCSYGKVKLRCDRRNQSPNPHIGRAVSKLQPFSPSECEKTV